MNRFEQLFKSKQKVFVPFFTLGDPNIEDSLRIIKAAIDAGADVLELGIPFSDPVADGPTNQRSMIRARQAGATFDLCLEMIQYIRHYNNEIPIGLLLYYNLIHRRGIDKAHQELAAAGVDGIVSADLPLDEAAEHEASLQKHGIGAVQMIAPNTPDKRAVELFDHSSAFTYVLSGFGTTGAKTDLDPKTLQRVKHLRALSDKPMIVGFGISKPEHVHAVWQAGADGAIVGSYFTKMIETHQGDVDVAIEEIARFIKACSFPRER